MFLLSVTAGLAGASHAAAKGDDLPVEVRDVTTTNDSRPAAPAVVLTMDGVRDIDIRVEVFRPNGTRVGGAKHAGRSVVAPGTAVRAGEVGARLGSTIEFAEARSDALADGLYVERIALEVVVDGADFPMRIIHRRYFDVAQGRVVPITATAYSKRTLILDTNGNQRMGAIAPARPNTGPVPQSNAEQEHSGDSNKVRVQP